MTNPQKLFGSLKRAHSVKVSLLFAVLIAVLAFSMAACNSESEPETDNTVALGQVVYTGKHNTNDLTLTITEKKNGKAVYAPKISDSYTLAVGENLSSGTVMLIETTDTTIKFTLKASKDGTIFTVTITLSNNKITNISGTVTFDGEGTWNGPGNVNNGTTTSGGGGGGSSSGGGGSSSSESGQTSTGTRLIVMDTATVNSNLVSISPDNKLVFENLEAKDTPVKGDIICSAPSEAAPYGFLYKAKTVTTSGGKTVIETEMATIEEAVEEAEVEQSFVLAFAENEEIDGVEVVRMSANANPTQRAAVASSIKLNIDKTVEGVNLKGTLELSATVDCNIKISWFTMKRFELSTKPQFKADLAASIGGKIEKEKHFTIYQQKFAPVTFWVGPLPVVFVPELTIECVVTAQGEVVLSATKLASWDYSYVFGVRYDGSKLGAFQENVSKPAKYLEGLQLELNGEVKVEPRVTYMYGLYGTVYAGMSGGFYARLAGTLDIPIGASANTNAKLSLSCGLAFAADAKLEILGKKIGELRITFYTVEWPIWEKTWSTTTAVAVTGVSLNKTTLSLAVGTTDTLVPTVTPTNATNKNVTWSSNNTAVAEVSNSGTVTGVSVGTTTITVKTADGNKTAACIVTVNPVPVNSVSVKTSTSLVVGGTETLYAEIEPPNATNKSVTWSSSNTTVAEVSVNGVVTAKSAGTAVITVKTADGNETATCNVTVSTSTVAVTGISLNKTSTTLNAGSTETLVATIAPSNATNQNVTWSSSNAAVATVSNSGVVTGVAAGSATITASTVDGGKTASCTVTVRATSWNVYDESTWNVAVNSIKNGGNNETYTINVTGNFSIPGTTASTFGNATGITVTINGNKEISLATGSTGSLLRIGANQTVIMMDLDLKGHNTNNASLVYISGANSSFTMQGSATVSGNTAGTGGGGVYVSSGTITMQGSATVSGNTAGTGGGVYVSSGTITMQGSATVSGNTASSGGGGGVSVGTNGTFTMQNNAAVSGNTASFLSGGGVSVSTNGTFTMQDNAKVTGNTASVGGGGVSVGTNGTFTMQNNAAVSGNIASTYGGGVAVNGTFTMQGSAIVFGNSTSDGGGVLVASTGTFTMQGGTVYGNVDLPLGNTCGFNGAALYILSNDSGSGTAKYGNGSNILPHTDGQARYTNNTILGHM